MSLRFSLFIAALALALTGGVLAFPHIVKAEGPDDIVCCWQHDPNAPGQMQYIIEEMQRHSCEDRTRYGAWTLYNGTCAQFQSSDTLNLTSDSSPVCCCTETPQHTCETKSAALGYNQKDVCSRLYSNNPNWKFSQAGSCPAASAPAGPTTTQSDLEITQQECAAKDTGVILPHCTCSGDCQLTDFVQLFINLYAFALKLLVPLAIFYLIAGAVFLLTAAGYENRIKQGKEIINQAVTGVIIMLVSWVIINTVFVLLLPTDSKGRHLIFQQPWNTLSKSFTYPCSSDFLSTGCVGGNVKQLQSGLVKLGYTLKQDSVYGSQTASAVSDFQKVTNAALTQDRGPSCSHVLWDVMLAPFCPDPNPDQCNTVTAAQLATQKLPGTNSATAQTQQYIITFGSAQSYISEFQHCKSIISP